MNQATIEEIAGRAALAAVKEYSHQASKKRNKKTKKETQALLRNYRAIKHVVEEGVSEASQLGTEIDFLEELDEDELFIASIRRSRIRSLMMLAHIDGALDALKNEQYGRNEEIKYYIFTYVCLDNMTLENAAEVYGCSAVTARRYKDEMVNKMSVYLFGIDGLTET